MFAVLHFSVADIFRGLNEQKCKHQTLKTFGESVLLDMVILYR